MFYLKIDWSRGKYANKSVEFSLSRKSYWLINNELGHVLKTMAHKAPKEWTGRTPTWATKAYKTYKIGSFYIYRINLDSTLEVHR